MPMKHGRTAMPAYLLIPISLREPHQSAGAGAKIPRKVLLLVPAGDAVEEALQDLAQGFSLKILWSVRKFSLPGLDRADRAKVCGVCTLLGWACLAIRCTQRACMMFGGDEYAWGIYRRLQQIAAQGITVHASAIRRCWCRTLCEDGAQRC